MQKILIAMIDFYPARLVRAKDRWYFCYYQTDPTTGQMRRHRESFNIGRIPIEQRLDKAKDILDSINARLPHGYPYDEFYYQAEVTMTASEALDLVMRQSMDLRPATLNSYSSWNNKFLSFLDQLRLSCEPITAISKKVAMAYGDYLARQPIGARSYNNDLNGISRVFEALRKQEIILVNPFVNIARRRVQKKTRCAIPASDIYVILDYLQEHDVSVYISCLMLFYCMIRPNEARQLQRAHFILDKSLIYIPPEISKNRKEGYITIPDEFNETLKATGIDSLPPDRFVIGAANSLGKDHPVSKSSISNRYRTLLLQMDRDRLIKKKPGNTLYSWKDTGGDALVDSVRDAVKIQQQFRHHSLSETQVYLSSRVTADPVIQKNHTLPTKS